MKKMLKYILGLSFVLYTTSCDQDFLNVTPEDRFPEESVWRDPGLVEGFVNEMYRGLNHGMRELMLGSLADESQFIHNYGSTQVVQSNLTPNDVGSFSRGDFDEFNWTQLYIRIRQVNLFKANIEKVPFETPEEKLWSARMRGEVAFLNAYFYHNLVRLYGGVPLVKQAYELESDFAIERSSLAECIAYIVAECDLAASLLPESYQSGGNDIGRATRGAALALKARILLYAASDLYNDASYAGGYANPQLISAPGDRTAKWQAAKDAAKAVMDLGLYSLQNTGQPVKDYIDLFLLKNSQEAIFSRYFIKSRGWEDGALPGLANGPNGYHNWGGNTPIQELVDDYEMVDGTRFSWSNTTHAAAPYENRDPRLQASILYDQALWRPRPSDVKEIDPVGKVIIRTVETEPGKFTPGLDTRDGPVEDWNGGYSGYYLRKFIDPTVVHEYAAAGGNQEAPWHFFRYGEVLMNYAEACIELGQDDEAKTVLNQIRSRAGMPAITETGANLMARYQNERRVELAFEQHRYFDIRRWMIAPQAMGRPANGIVINEDVNGKVTYTRNKIQDRAWADKMYWLPIDQNEMRRNSSLTQNPLY